ncbi:MAG: type II toxin-antitoxin system MqsR family toxin [Thermodesulfobacteriota bacterium]|nr:type II toxin-antitoxin system MqsR family toxin [Thermodesulfobacteriota bacterium]
MVKKKKRQHVYGRTEPYYSLGKVKKLIETEKYIIRRNALEGARKDFAWELPDILDALKKLQPKHFYKPGESYFAPKIPIDFYKAYNLKGEDVYIHFYIDKETEILIVDSFKRI